MSYPESGASGASGAASGARLTAGFAAGSERFGSVRTVPGTGLPAGSRLLMRATMGDFAGSPYCFFAILSKVSPAATV